ncbi:MAG TPA: polysaccharide deacetylase family protein [Candidatus Hydrogenedentes bacterium]|nr:polysaccharide deacetylase family protein [Candidatus Hydrogenedentota bacterium]HPG68791.1 polysaccharide deacetylase family protein [Candidatus Hydrogenedentota bacterium]
MRKLAGAIAALAWLIGVPAAGAEATYAERLGWPTGSRVVIFHVDDAGLCHDANMGAIDAIENGVATSTSVMMPCPCVPEIAAYAKEHPDLDVGMHITLTSEWPEYRWGPLAGRDTVPGLVDPDGALWRGVLDVASHAEPSEVETEIRAQLAHSRAVGIEPTHLDTHMGVVLLPAFINRYMTIGIEEGIPVLVPGGHIQASNRRLPFPSWYLRWKTARLWNAGLPVIDTLVLAPAGNGSYEDMRERLIAVIRGLRPGISQFIVHCTQTTEEFGRIGGSGSYRLAELRLMKDPAIKQAIVDEGVILTTWRELKARRDGLATQR